MKVVDISVEEEEQQSNGNRMEDQQAKVDHHHQEGSSGGECKSHKVVPTIINYDEVSAKNLMKHNSSKSSSNTHRDVP